MGADPSLDVAEGGAVELLTGCNTGSSTVAVQDGTLTLSAPRITRKACDGAAGQVERALLDVIDGEIDEFVVSGTTLVLTRAGAGARAGGPLSRGDSCLGAARV